MSVANECAADLIAAVRAVGGTIRRDGDTIELAAPVPLPADLMAGIRAAKPALLAALDVAAGPLGDFRGSLDNFDPEAPFGDMPSARLWQFRDDARALIDTGRAAQAMALGWTLTDLFGCDE